MTKGHDLADTEKSNVDELRRRMKDLMTPELYEDDNVFERFLRARNQNIDAAEVMLKKHLKWRKMHQIDTIRKPFKPTEFFFSYDCMTQIGYDKEGAPVIYVAFGKIDIRGAYKCVDLRDIFKFLIRHLEEYIEDMKIKSKELGKSINQWNMIFDYDGLTLSNATFKPGIQYLIQTMSMYEANYPERLKSAYLINGSFVFQICFAMFRPFFVGNTLQKIHFYTTDFQNDLLKMMDADQLPAFLGGNRTDPDGNPRCEQSIKFGGVCDEKYYLVGKNRKASVIPDSKLLVVDRFSKSRIEVEVIHPGSTIEWNFKVKNRNIDFSVWYKEHRSQEDSMAEEFIPKQRIETQMSYESGMAICEKTGIYFLEFDNSFSWFNSKVIYYTINVVKLTNTDYNL